MSQATELRAERVVGTCTRAFASLHAVRAVLLLWLFISACIAADCAQGSLRLMRDNQRNADRQ